MQNVVIVGAGKGGTAILKLFQQVDMLNINAVADVDSQAPGLRMAEQQNILTYNNYEHAINDSVDIIVEATGNQQVFDHYLTLNQFIVY